MLDRKPPEDPAAQEEIISNIAREIHRPIPVVRRVYEAEFKRLKAMARVTDYLVLFASRRTRDALLASQQ